MAPIDPMTVPPHNCSAHSGLSGRVNLVIALLMGLIGMQMYAVNINTETRLKLAEFGADIGRIAERTISVEQRVSRLEEEYRRYVQVPAEP